MHSFSNLHRQETLEILQRETFDLLVLGGGITGAGIALDAASRGLRVALIEKGDFASGTSSKSTKLIHGGLRYLKQFDFWLVKEVGTERAILHQLAPHLVVPEKMILPIIEDGTYGTWLTSIGLKVYDLLASVEGDDKRKMLDRETAVKKEPLLDETDLEGAGYYAEYRTDDARLTIEVLKTAGANGATAVNYCEAEGFIRKDDRITGVVARDSIGEKQLRINTRLVVNAAGPWVDDIREELDATGIRGKRLQPTKGVHLVFPREKLPVRQSIYFDVPDGRMIFAIPRGKVTYVGTTDTKYFGDPDAVATDLADALYLISAVNNMFPDAGLKLEDVQSSWAGLRPLIYEEGKTASELSRKDEIFESGSGLVSIAGGKLTGYRKMAERTVDLACKRLQKSHDSNCGKVQTETIPLTPDPFADYGAVKAYEKDVLQTLEPYGFGPTEVQILVHRFGRALNPIMDKFMALPEEDFRVRMARAQLWFCVQHEMVITPLDFFERRTGMLYFEAPEIEILKDPILLEFQKIFGWNAEILKKNEEILETALYHSRHFT